ncbi:MAG TPA: D-aminoacylase [Acidimicrobiia bacterium]|nr:D-aminoacylase [Acidimicrobiia bacterium]
MHDVVIRGGVVVDGTGATARAADVAIDGDRITEVGTVTDKGKREVDAAGAYVTPGFVDVHTHLDAQLAWDPDATSSCWHGVTSVVLGNCGVAFAPVRKGQEQWLAEMMESVEDIPAASILEGLDWSWETYGEYLQAIDKLPKGVNVGGMVGHCSLRHFAMGERGLDEAPATDDDIAIICELVDEAMAGGALGFSTSRTLLHRVPDGRPVPGTWADERELLAIADVLGKHGKGVYEVAPRFERPGAEFENTRTEVHWMAEINRRTGRPVTFGLAHSNALPELYQRILQFVDEEAANGGELRPQTTARGIGLLFGMQHRTFFDRAPEWAALQPLPLEERVEVLRNETRRAELLAAATANTPPLPFDGVYVLTDDAVDYSADPETSLAAHAARHNETIAEAFIRISLESNGRALFNFPFLNERMDAVEELLDHPRMAIGLGDSGAHVGLIMDASLPTWFLLHWVRDRKKYSIEDAIRRMTSDTANLFGVVDRGVLAPGQFADVNVLDLDRLALPLPEYVHDFPAGAGRYVQKSDGYRATLVNGAIFVEDGEPTGNHAGVTLRSVN